MMRTLKYTEAILEATAQCMERDKNVFVMGLGVPDPKGIFGTTLGLAERFGKDRAFDIPASENGMTGVAIGAAIRGSRPIMTHQRIDFALLSLDQLINNAAKWRYMFGDKLKVPIVIRLIIGRGWGQGPQHSQALHSIFAHIPGLKVVMPATPCDAKGLLVSAIQDDDPVIFIEHRWLHSTFGEVPEEIYRVDIGGARTARAGRDISIVTASHMVLEALHAAAALEKDGIDCEVIDLRSIRPIDKSAIIQSVKKSGRLLALDLGHLEFGLSSEITAIASESCSSSFKCNPRRIALPDHPTPTSPDLSADYYPRAINIANEIQSMLGLKIKSEGEMNLASPFPLDVPDSTFLGPF